jgi:alpha-N-acetylglucosaminidase
MRSVHLHLVVILLGLLRSLSVAHAADVPGFDLRPAAGVLHRLSPDEAAQIQLGTLAPEDGHERFRISNANGHVRVEGSSTSALLFGVHWYLKYVTHVQISPNGDRLGLAHRLPLPAATIERETPTAIATR